MDYERLLTAAGELGYQLAMCGAEIYRVEESVQRLLAAYGVQGEVFAITNCVILSLTTEEGRTVTQLRRIPPHGTDIYLLEAYNDLCRRLCREAPPLEEAERDIRALNGGGKHYAFPTQLLAHFVGAGAFTLFFGGDLTDALAGGACGIVIGLCLRFMTRLMTNQFFKTMAAATLSALLAQVAAHFGLVGRLDAVIIGALMILVPGMAFTTAMRDIMAGDMIAGIGRAGESLLIGVAIAIGTGLAVGLCRLVWGV